MFFQEIHTELSLRGTEHEHLDSKLDAILDEIHKATQVQDKDDIKTKLAELEATLANVMRIQRTLTSDTGKLTDRVTRAEEEIRGSNTDHRGTSYTRWGKTVCPGNGSDVLYSGYAAGGYYTHTGASPSMLCLPEDPVWSKYDDSLNAYGQHVYGVEYQDKARGISFWGRNMYDQDAPCVVCEVKGRARRIMIPGRTTCYPGWTKEYWGYLMSSHYEYTGQGDYHCVDSDPEAIEGGHENHNGYLLYFVEVRCGALKCPPYVKGRELPCVVCTK